MQKKIHLISLGCSRNRVDSEIMLGNMFGGGWQHSQDPQDADAIIINTCGFIQSAKEESIDTILECADIKKKNPDLKLIVSGCLTQRYKSQLVKGLPEVDLFIGTDEFSKISDLVDGLFAKKLKSGSLHAKRSHYLYDESLARVNTLEASSAYVKVAEGCQHNCAFCIIPAIRGKLRSRRIASVRKEVEELAKTGVREINLIAQDLAAFGREEEWPDKSSVSTEPLLELLQELCTVEGISWIRLLYVYPENISDEFLDFLATNDKIVKYLDIPVQHASDKILKSMNRQIDKKGLYAIFQKLRNRIPEISLRTSVMVGFPGETEEDFAELQAFVKEMQFDHLGCFSYSQEEGTLAGRMKEQIDDETKQQRQRLIMQMQQEISKEKLTRLVGRKLPVLVLGPSKESDLLWEGRMSTQAPEVDGVVYINDGNVKAGNIQMVLISQAHDYDLVGEVCED